MTVAPDDRAFRLGDGLFETVRVEPTGPLALPMHIARFRGSARELGFPASSLRAGVAALEGLTTVEPGVWRVTVSRDDPSAPFGGSGCVAISRREVRPCERPRLQTMRGWHFPGYLLAEHKTTSFVRGVEARRRAAAAGFDDALLVSADGVVGEASAANVFAVLRDGAIVTPAVDGILPGTARRRVLVAQRELGIDVEVRELRADELSGARELVLTNAAIGAVAALSVDGAELGCELSDKLRAFLLEAAP